MKDKRIKSLIEAILNILVGFSIAFISNLIILPLFGYNVTIWDSLGMSLIFTIISLIRSYTLRRLFVNWLYENILIKNNKW